MGNDGGGIVGEKATGRDKYNKYRPIGTEIAPLRSPTEGHDAHGRPSQIVKDEFPTRIDEVSKTLFYLGWAELGELDDQPYWKIRRIRQIGIRSMLMVVNGIAINGQNVHYCPIHKKE